MTLLQPASTRMSLRCLLMRDSHDLLVSQPLGLVLDGAHSGHTVQSVLLQVAVDRRGGWEGQEQASANS